MRSISPCSKRDSSQCMKIARTKQPFSLSFRILRMNLPKNWVWVFVIFQIELVNQMLNSMISNHWELCVNPSWRFTFRFRTYTENNEETVWNWIATANKQKKKKNEMKWGGTRRQHSAHSNVECQLPTDWLLTTTIITAVIIITTSQSIDEHFFVVLHSFFSIQI